MIWTFAFISLSISLDSALSTNCPTKITISSRRPAFITNNEDWTTKVGRYSLKRYENGNAIYENDQQSDINLYKSKQGNWMVGNKLGEDFGWIANSKCDSECPSSCPEGSWIYWHGVTGGRGTWKSDSTLMVDGCIKWRQTGQCSAQGPREPDHDKSCDEEIKWKSGYCECSNGRKEMEKRCETPAHYGYEFNTCEQACSYRGMIANGFLSDNQMQSDEPVSSNELPETYRNAHWTEQTCSTVSADLFRKSYATYEEAKTACSNDLQCSFVLDEGCDGRGAFKLCDAMSFVQDSSSDCLFAKEHN